MPFRSKTSLINCFCIPNNVDAAYSGISLSLFDEKQRIPFFVAILKDTIKLSSRNKLRILAKFCFLLLITIFASNELLISTFSDTDNNQYR